MHASLMDNWIMPGIEFLMLNRIKTIRVIKFHIARDNTNDPFPFCQFLAKVKFNTLTTKITQIRYVEIGHRRSLYMVVYSTKLEKG